MSAEGKFELKQLSQSTFPSPVSIELLAASPTLDLVATVTNGNTLAIRRAQGELVSSSTERGKLVQALCWKSDGLFVDFSNLQRLANMIHRPTARRRLG